MSGTPDVGRPDRASRILVEPEPDSSNAEGPSSCGLPPFDPGDPIASEIVNLLRAEADDSTSSENRENDHAQSTRLRPL
jgi:hypothetical protein